MKNKNIILTLMAAVLLICNHSAAVAGGPNTKEVMVDGIKVIIKQTPKEVISVRMFIRGGNASVPADKQGLENFALSLAAEGGTTKRNKEVFATECENIGTDISAFSTYE